MLDLNYALPDFTSGLQMNLSLIERWHNNPEMFRDGVCFDNVYDCFPRRKANGGRHHLGQQYPSHWMHVYNLNKDYDFIAQVAHPERLEVMVNELCAPGCPVRKRLLCG